MENGNKILIRMMLTPRTKRIVMKVLYIVLSIQEVTDNSAAKTDESLTDHKDSKMSRKDNKDTDLSSGA